MVALVLLAAEHGKGMIKGPGPFLNNMGVYGNDFGPTKLP